MATQQYGLTSAGFVLKQQNEIIIEINAILQTIFGSNANLSPTAVLGQLVGIFSEREALLWMLIEAVYNSGYPAGAEGTSVDNILALTNLRRLPATATVTAPTNTQGTPGLVFFGTALTTIPQGSIISVNGNPLIQFKTNAAYTINAAVNAIQLLSTYGGTPTTGHFAIQIVDAALQTLITENLPSNVLPNQSQINFSAAPSSATSFELTLTLAGATLTTGAIACASTYPTSGAIQTAIRALTGYSAVSVSGSAGAYTVSWGAIPQPILGVTANTTGVTISTIDSIQAAINNLYDAVETNYPYTDVSASGTFAAPPGGFTITFGANTVVAGQPSSGGQPQGTITIPTSGSQAITLSNASGNVSMNCVTTTVGAPAQVTGAATCSSGPAGPSGTGPNFVAAGALSVIGSPIAGWASVTNPLDCITGTNIETDTAALARRAALLADNANGPLQSIIDKVSQVSGVVQAVGYQNLSLAAQQVVAFTGTASAGTFILAVTNLSGSYGTNPIAWNADPTLQTISAGVISGTPSGAWTLTLGSTTITGLTATSTNSTASYIQSQIQANVPGYSTATVVGSFTSGYTIGNNGLPELALSVSQSTLTNATVGTVTDSIQSAMNQIPGYSFVTISGSIGAGAITINFNGSNGGQPQGLVTATNNLTGISAISVTYGLPGKAIWILINDNNGEASNAAVAEAIFGSKPGGIASYGDGSANSVSNIVTDAFGNNYTIYFSRPTEVPISVLITLKTDLATNPSPKFQPSSIITIQDDIAEIGGLVGVGGTIVGFGTNGLIGAFNGVPGILGYTMYFGPTANGTPTSNANISMLNTQVPQFETYLVQVSYT